MNKIATIPELVRIHRCVRCLLKNKTNSDEQIVPTDFPPVLEILRAVLLLRFFFFFTCT